MAEVIVLLSVDGRNFHLKLEEGDLSALKDQFRSVCSDDIVLKTRLETHEPCFSWRKSELKGTPFEDQEFELLSSDFIENFSFISVKWVERNLANQTEKGVKETPVNNTLQPKDTDYPTRHCNPVPFNLTLAKYYTQLQWDALNPAEQLNETARLEQHNLLMTMGVTPSAAFKPVTISQQPSRAPRATSRSAAPNDIGSAEPSRKSARRTSRNKENVAPTTTVARDVPTFFQESDNEDDNFVTDPVEVQVPSVPSTSRVHRREIAPKLKPRKFGSRFNSFNSLPKFNPHLATMLAAGKKVSRQSLLTEIKAHLQSKLHKGEKLDKEDYDIVCERIVREYPVLGNADDRTKFSDLKHSVQKSMSSQTYYRTKGKARRAAALAQRRAQAFDQQENEADRSQQQKENEAGHSQQQIETRNNEIEQNNNDKLVELKEGKQSESRMRYLIRITLPERKPHEFEVGNLNSMISNWPHYKNALMLMYEYSLKESLQMDTLIQNAASFLEKLQGYLGEPDELTCLTVLQDKLTPTKFKNEKVKPLISVIEAVLADGVSGVLDDTFEERSPHVIVTTDYNDDGEWVATAGVSKLSMDCCSLCKNPTPATIIVLSLAPYFLFNLTFPPAYESTLRLFEKNVHGSLSTFTARKRAKAEYRAFILDFEK